MNLACLLLALAAALWPLLRSHKSLAGTTLRAPWAWTLAAELAVATTDVVAEGFAYATGSWQAATALRYAAAITTYLPMMAVLGAKRPQDRGWQFVVVSLWIVLALPCGHSWLLGRAFHVYPAWSWFLAAMLLVQLGNYLPTRRWPAALLATAAQAILLWDWLPGSAGSAGFHQGESWNPWPAVEAIGLAALAAWSIELGALVRPAEADPLDRVWRDFRDWFGALWSLRVLERVNSAARLSGWPVELDWGGFFSRRAEPGGIDPATQAALAATMHTLLRRFVSPEWLAERLAAARPLPEPPHETTS